MAASTIAVVLLGVRPTAQTQANTHISTGSALPASCRVGDLFYKTGTSSGLYTCSASNTWSTGSGSGTVTNTGTLTANHLLVGNGGSDITAKTATDGQIPIGKTSDGTVTLATITAGTNISVTNGAGSITIAATGAAAAPGMVLVQQQTASSSASLDFTSCISSTYDDYWFEFVRVIPATDNVNFYFRVSYDGGSTWQTAASSYFWVLNSWYGNLTNRSDNDGSAGMTSTAAIVARTVDTTIGASLAGVSGTLKLYAPGSTINHRFVADVAAYDNANIDAVYRLFGRNTGTTAVNAVQFLFSSGNISSGTIRCYGLAK